MSKQHAVLLYSEFKTDLKIDINKKAYKMGEDKCTYLRKSVILVMLKEEIFSWKNYLYPKIKDKEFQSGELPFEKSCKAASVLNMLF